MDSKTKTYIFLTIFAITFSQSSTVTDFFTGDALSEKALRYNKQEAIIKNAPTKTNDLPSISALLSDSAFDIENRLGSRAADAIALANAAKQSTTSGTGVYEEGPKSCCIKSVETGYDNYFKAEVDLQSTCYRGVCTSTQ